MRSSLSSLRFCLKILLLPASSLAYFPFYGEDAGTIGKRWGLEAEADFAYFRYYDGSQQRDYVFQMSMGVTEDIDLAVVIPYSRLSNGSKLEGLNDVSLYVKHIPYRGRLSLGYKVQVNLDTGKEGLGYGKTTYNVNLIGEFTHGRNTLNLNLHYKMAKQVENLRDSYGLSMGMFRAYSRFDLGVELTALLPEDKSVRTLDTHIVAGVSYHAQTGFDINFGLQKSLVKRSGFADYGIFVGTVVSF